MSARQSRVLRDKKKTVFFFFRIAIRKCPIDDFVIHSIIIFLKNRHLPLHRVTNETDSTVQPRAAIGKLVGRVYARVKRRTKRLITINVVENLFGVCSCNNNFFFNFSLVSTTDV